MNERGLPQRAQQAAAKSAAIVLSSYIPWKGYFDLINFVDVFILYRDVQYARRDWRNRDLIKTRVGLQWLTLPMEVERKYTQMIRETRITDTDRGRKHWAAISHSYAKA